jgi:serine protease AprX
MNKTLFTLLIFVSFSSFSQEDAWVYFANKPSAGTFLSNPLSMLTQRALDRRIAQNIALDETDVPIHQPYIDQVVAANGIEVKAKSKWMNCLHVRGTIENITALAANSFVSQIVFADDALNTSGKINKEKSDQKLALVNKKLETEENFSYGTSANQIQMLNGHLLHQANYTGAGKIIAVLDSGFINVNSTAPFQRLVTNNAILGGYNFVNQSTNVFSLHNHGTLVLSCMGGFVEGQLVGTAPDAQYYLYVTEDISSENPVEESYWVEAAEEADRVGADVINSSLGYYYYDNPNYSHTFNDFTGNKAFASRGANWAFSKGIIVVASAGNSGGSASPLNRVAVPAEANSALAIGAVRPDESYATFSSIGPTFDGRVKPDVMAQGQQSVVANTAGNIQTASGTSFSGPIMAGMVASLWQAIPWATNAQVVQFIKQSSDKYSNPTNQHGYGIPDFQVALNIALLSINAQVYNNQFLVYPNPTKGEVMISIPENFKQAEIKIFNFLGQSVVEKSNLNDIASISLDGLESGVYFYTISNQFSSKSGKIIKN